MQTQHEQTTETLLAEILPIPAEQIITDRFIASEAAACSGNCSSGVCKTAQ